VQRPGAYKHGHNFPPQPVAYRNSRKFNSRHPNQQSQNPRLAFLLLTIVVQFGGPGGRDRGFRNHWKLILAETCIYVSVLQGWAKYGRELTQLVEFPPHRSPEFISSAFNVSGIADSGGACIEETP
jgi:hypothetical protein